jgi:hypothetical protein
MERVTEPIATIQTVVQRRTTHKSLQKKAFTKLAWLRCVIQQHIQPFLHKETNMAFKASIYVHVSGGWLNWFWFDHQLSKWQQQAYSTCFTLVLQVESRMYLLHLVKPFKNIQERKKKTCPNPNPRLTRSRHDQNLVLVNSLMVHSHLILSQC